MLTDIDGGSCTNVAFKTLVDKLKLHIVPHPAPYTLLWLNYGKGIHISSKCLVSLSIGKVCRDEIWCSEIPMDASHVLLSRQWLFDRGVIHDGRLNTDSFVKDYKKITPTLLKLSQIQKPKDSPQLDVLHTTLLRSQQHVF